MRLRRVPAVVGLTVTGAGTAIGVITVAFYAVLLVTRPPPGGSVDAGGFAGPLLLAGLVICVLSGVFFAALYHNVVGHYGRPGSLEEVALTRTELATAMLLGLVAVGYFVLSYVPS